ncbi:MAG TPA: transposase [Myxococcota bacterium]|nr:transposase [Myxococcota bacterium]
MHRGARRAPIFKVQDDCTDFLDIAGETVDRFGLEVHAYSLMPNHCHLLIRSVAGNLSQGMQYLNGTYTLLLNRRHRWDGPVFRGRFHSQLVEDEEHLRVLIAYIHLNPLRALLIRRLSDEAWTSHRAYLGKEPVPEWLSTKVFLDLLGGPKKLHDFVLSFHRCVIEYPEDFNPETGLFHKKGLAVISGVPKRVEGKKKREVVSRHHRQRPVMEVLAEICNLTGATEEELKMKQNGPGANPSRRFAVWALNRSAVISQHGIGKLLNVPYNQVTRLLGRIRKEGASEPVAGWMNTWLHREGI